MSPRLLDVSRRLIQVVRERPLLWQSDHPLRYERNLIRAVWEEVASISGLPRHIAKLKWKNIKDAHRREAKKVAMNRKYKPKWVYYKYLSFLYTGENKKGLHYEDEDDIDEGSNHTYDLPVTPETSQNGAMAIEPKVELFFEEEEDTSHLFSEVQDPILVEERPEMQSKPEDRIDINPGPSCEREMSYLNEENDEDLHFFKSLLPHVKLLSAKKKMLVRMKMQEIIYNEVYSKEED